MVIKKISIESLYPEYVLEPIWVITSRCIVNISDYVKVGGFDKKLFIGQIDKDYCCNLNSQNKKIIRIGNANIYQEAGNTTTRTLLWKKNNGTSI